MNDGYRGDDDRRLAPRVPAHLAVKITMVDEQGRVLVSGPGVIADVSENGLRFVIEGTGPDSPCNPRFLMAVPQDPELQELWIQTRPVRIRRLPDLIEIGCELVSASPALRPMFARRLLDRVAPE